MGNVQGHVFASVSVCSVYLIYVHIYCAHKALKTNVLYFDKLPSFVYLYVKYWFRSLTRREGCLYAAHATTDSQAVYTVLNCRLKAALLRRFCSVAGYGWDYPDTEYRDIPLCCPVFLCGRLILMLLTDEKFRLRPTGLICVRQSLKTLQPIDELKKGPFMLQVQVLGYQQTDAGVEVDISLSATSRSGCPVWESVLTLLSKTKLHKSSSCLSKNALTSEMEENNAENVKQIELRVPRSAGLLGSFSDCCPHWLVSLPAMFFSFRSQRAPSLWMLSVCLAEIEKHKGVAIITAPVTVTAQFKEPPLIPGKVTIRFCEETKNADQSSARSLSFYMTQRGCSLSHMVGLISRS
ncbi:uncharacterized protein si:ch211-12e13.1 [Mugil cephalus]|uniref:uncharacterized protein si:ch211-12e13.1 n=1 Tax=Mugil cephalus TaxID=48193 RepID=UPI001FB8036E|nr:uncharacterized protein si:ch211-12e13.1 [Mugil cephalus]